MTKNHMTKLYFELTRRCNLKCNFCCRGDAQNMDMSKEIIDKTMDEIKNIHIHALNPYGGEPFLVPELFEYLIDKIIENKIWIDRVIIYTNGTIIDERIKTSLIKIANYIEENEHDSESCSVSYAFVYRYHTSNKQVMEEVRKAKVSVMISQLEHNNADSIKKFIEFYSDKNIYIALEDDEVGFDKYGDSSRGFIISGKFERNYKECIKSRKYVYSSKFRAIYNYFSFIYADIDGDIAIDKNLTVSANGNVFVGGSMDYDRVDKENMFNILDCHNDFIDRIIDFCYNHPIVNKAKSMQESYLSLKWAKEHNVDYSGLTNNDLTVLKNINDEIEFTKKIGRKLHVHYPTLSPEELCKMAYATTILCMYEKRYSDFDIKYYAECCTDFDAELIETLNANYIVRFIQSFKEKDAERQKNHVTWRNPQGK